MNAEILINNNSSKNTADLSLSEKDKRYLWHPFTQMQDWQEEEPLIIAKGEGVYLQDVEGRNYLDGVSSLWCNVHGHQVPELDQAVKTQLEKVAHSTFLGLTNPPAIELAEKLVEISPQGLSRVFYSDSGSSSVEIAVKMAYQYWKQKGRPEKNMFVKLTEAYHGDTLGSVSVGGIDLFHQIFEKLLFETYSLPTPSSYATEGKKTLKKAISDMEALFAEHHEHIAAFVLEPLVQGAAGMLIQPEGYISRARDLTKKYNILLICDEVATGFGRTGKMFACEHEGVSPDLMTVAKGITGGYLPLAATLATEEIYEAFLGRQEELKTFFHGHTYTANPLACAVAKESLNLFEKHKVLFNLEPKIAYLKSRLEQFYDIPQVGEIRQKGMMVGIELVRNRETKKPFEAKDKIGIRVIEKAREQGAILRPLGSVIVLMPPLAINLQELEKLLDITYDSIKETVET